MVSLSLLTFLPLLGALLLLFVPEHRTDRLRAVALLVTGLTALLGAILYASFPGGSAGFEFVAAKSWFRVAEGIEVSYRLGVDGISILMVALTALIMPIVILSTWGHIRHRVKEFLVWMLVMETGMLGVFLSLDLVLFYVFWEVSLVPLYFIVGIWGGERRLYATVKFFLYTVAGSLLMLIAVIALIYVQGSSDIELLLAGAGRLSEAQQTWTFLAFALAFAIKVPVLPFHTWLADAHTEAPTSGSVVLAGVLLKMGTYGLLRFGIGMFPEVALAWAPFFMALGALGIVYGAFLAMAQTDVKRLIACSSVSHLGYVVLGLFALTQAGLRGGVLQMVNHGLSTGLLFLLIGMLYERRHTRQISQFGGVAARMPLFALFFVVAVLSSVGLPGLNGFVGEYMILLGAFQASPLWAVVGVSGVVFGAVYLLSATRRMLFGPVVSDENAALRDIGAREIGLSVPVIAFIVWIGVQPNFFLGRTDGAIDALVERLDEARAVARAEADEPGALAAAPAPAGGEHEVER